MQGCLAELWDSAARRSRCLSCGFFVWKESLALFFNYGIISPSEEQAALGLRHLMCDLRPLFPRAVPAHQILTWGCGVH